MSLKIKGYGWKPDLPDHRDHSYAAPVQVLTNLPRKIDLRPQCPSQVYSQGQLGSCTANAIAAAIEFDLLKQKRQDFMPSRLFIYYNERDIEGTVDEDSGAMIRDGVKSVARQGVCPETECTYDTDRFTEKPPENCYEDALKTRARSYARVARTLNQFKGCLASGYPFVFGFSVYESFESEEVAQSGIATIPTSQEKLLGGHAVLAVGYDDDQNRFIVRNSWGDSWGMKGYFTMPYSYLLDENLSDDFWTIRIVG
ncbi:MAG: C1 family peptidase [Candidatus Nitrosocosmicus sp.]